MKQTYGLSATFFFSIGSALMVGYILVMGKSVIVPLLIAIVVVILLLRAVAWLSRLSILKACPHWTLHFIVLALAVTAAFFLGSVIAATLQEMAERAPSYQANLEAVLRAGSSLFGLESDSTWHDIRKVTFDQINLSYIAGTALGSLASLTGSILLITVYSAFLMAESAKIPSKMQLVFTRTEDARQFSDIMSEISVKVSDYLSAKSGINIILSFVSFLILYFFGVDFAVFWAISIALLNYVPYIGSAIGVLMPVTLSLAQFGDLWTSLLLTFCLAAAQLVVGNILEPRLIGRHLNLAPFSIILSLSIWSSLWGVVGAILAIPLTSVLIIIFREINGIKPLAILLSDVQRDEIPNNTHKPSA